jgi:hypothetical protein
VKVVIDIPVRTSTPGNTRRHWRADWREARHQRDVAVLAAVAALNALPDADRLALESAPAVTVRVTRFSGRRLDTPNVWGACKHCIDGVCDALGADDGSDWYVWTVPEQAKGKPGVRIELEW